MKKAGIRQEDSDKMPDPDLEHEEEPPQSAAVDLSENKRHFSPIPAPGTKSPGRQVDSCD